MSNHNTSSSSELYHHGVKGMKWGVRKKSNYRSTGIRSALARRSNEKVDKSFKNWNENAKKRTNAIDLGKKANQDRMAYEKNKSDKSLKTAYKQSSKAYKKALRGNTTYRKGQIKSEVGKDISRKYLSEAKKVKKQLDKNPNNKELKKQYSQLMSKHDVERASARRAPEVAAKRSAKKASIKRTMTMTVKAAATTAVVGAGLYATNKYVANGKININAQQVIEYANKAKKVLGYI